MRLSAFIADRVWALMVDWFLGIFYFGVCLKHMYGNKIKSADPSMSRIEFSHEKLPGYIYIYIYICVSHG